MAAGPRLLGGVPLGGAVARDRDTGALPEPGLRPRDRPPPGARPGGRPARERAARLSIRSRRSGWCCSSRSSGSRRGSCFASGRAWVRRRGAGVRRRAHALYWGHHNGFLQQGYALPIAGLRPACCSRAPARPRAGGRRARRCWRCRSRSWSRSTCRSCPCSASRPRWHSRRPVRRCGRDGVGGCASCCCSRLRRRLRRAFRGARRAGRAVAAPPLRDERGGRARPVGRRPTSSSSRSGTRVLAPGWVNVEVAPWSALNRALTPLYVALVLAGLWHAARRPRTRPLAGRRRPARARGRLLRARPSRIPGAASLGHTWNLFKLAQWGWPFALLLAALAVQRLAPRAAALAAAVARPRGPASREPGRRPLAVERTLRRGDARDAAAARRSPSCRR